MAQGIFPFKCETEKNATGMTALAGLHISSCGYGQKDSLCGHRRQLHSYGQMVCHAGHDCDLEPTSGCHLYGKKDTKYPLRLRGSPLWPDDTLPMPEKTSRPGKDSGQRLDIEVFFKMAKQHLKLAKEIQCRDFDALIAHTTTVFMRYMFLAYTNAAWK